VHWHVFKKYLSTSFVFRWLPTLWMGCSLFSPFFIPAHWEFKTQRNNYTPSVVYLLSSHEYSRTLYHTLLLPCSPCQWQTCPSYIPCSHRTTIWWTVEWLSQPCWPISRADQRDPVSNHLSTWSSVYMDLTSSPSSLQDMPIPSQVPQGTCRYVYYRPSYWPCSYRTT